MAKFLTLHGQSKNIYLPKYQVNWDKECRSIFQKRVKDFFRPYWCYDYVYEEMMCVGTQLKLDLYNHSKKIAVESHGLQHRAQIHWNKRRGDFIRQVRKDIMKQEWCFMNDIKFLEIYERNLPLTREWIEETFGKEIL